ncbi:hypothetical protein [Polaribacter sp. Hel_I_88]|uniref:hypothetical protein n=1 Tax=Polaribacter sp. Hel_I_88 TaxID=1250006 RepID=UPI00047DCA9F|nr:hypothetical protein [Polaribacter sp. Hel_I_88]
MNWLDPLINLVKDFFQGRRELKKLDLQQKKAIIIAETKRIESNTIADNDIDYLTVNDKKYTYKDDVLIYLFLVPVFSATIVPFIRAFNSSNFENLNIYILESYTNLNSLPIWYKYVLFAIVIDVLGFRSFTRKLVENYSQKIIKNLKK